MFTIGEIAAATGSPVPGSGGEIRCGGVSTDSRTIKPGQVFVAIKGESFDGHDFIPQAVARGASCIVGERGKIPLLGRGVFPVAVPDSVRALADIARFHRMRFDIPLIAVTGSNGKTTAKDLCAWVLGGRFSLVATDGTKNNHIGVPLTLLGLSPRHQAAVVEFGTNHFGEIRSLALTALPTIGVITNIGPSHLEYFGGLPGVFREKWTLVRNLADPAVAIVNADDPYLARTTIAKKRKPFIISIGIRSRCDFRAHPVADTGSGIRFRLAGREFILNTPGRHNVYNALAACAAARVMGMGYPEIASRLRSFVFPAGRLTVIRSGGATFIDDSYNSSPASLGQALETLGKFRARGRRILVMGDMLELGGRQEKFHREAGRQARKACTLMIAVGPLSRLALEEFLDGGGRGKTGYACDEAGQARRLLESLALTGRDVVLVKGSRRMKLDLIFKK